MHDNCLLTLMRSLRPLLLQRNVTLDPLYEFSFAVQEYAKDGDKFFDDFAAAYHKLLHLGVPVSEPGKHAPA